MKKVLWLASWYPHAADPFSGDFIKRLAEAVSIFQPLKIVYTGKTSLNPAENTSSPGTESPNLQEYMLTYPASSRDNFYSKCRSLFNYFKKHEALIRQFRKKNELPDIVHVQVALKAGLIALYLKWKYKIPYVLTEHWSGYYPQAKDSLFRKSIVDRYLTRLVLRKAAMLITVSEALGNQIQQYWLGIPFCKIPNVVNTHLFFPKENKPETRFRFIHISTLQYPKNPEGIIRAFAVLYHQGMDSELLLVGPANPGLEKMIRQTALPEIAIRCTGEISYEQVGIELRNSSALVLFSYYENMPCVILESLCSGVPVIASRVGGVPEVINDDNGILVHAGDEVELQQAMKTMMLNVRHYQREKISKLAAEEFSYEVVGKKIIAIYNGTLNKK